MLISSFLMNLLYLTPDPFVEWTELFNPSLIFSFLFLSFICGFGLFISYMYLEKFFEPFVSSSVFLFEPILATLFIFVSGVEMLPGPLACLGYVFVLPGRFLILLTRYLIQKRIDKKKKISELKN